MSPGSVPGRSAERIPLRRGGSAGPRTVIGVPAYRHADHVGAALDSLLAQSDPDFAVIVVDDLSNDDTSVIARQRAEADSRVNYYRNDVRLGLVRNWRRCFELARMLFPRAPYFAWASDHDLWHPDWLAAMTAALGSHPEAVLAYPTCERFVSGHEPPRVQGGFETMELVEARDRLRLGFRDRSMRAGNVVYGLIRAQCLERVGVFRQVIQPDRLLLAELAAQGRFCHVGHTLWQRRFLHAPSRSRQRHAIFPDRRPLHSWLPPSITHPAAFLWLYGVRRNGAPAIGRRTGVRLTAVYAVAGFRHVIEKSRRLAPVRRRLKRGKRRLVRTSQRQLRKAMRQCRRSWRTARRVTRAVRRAGGGLYLRWLNALNPGLPAHHRMPLSGCHEGELSKPVLPAPNRTRHAAPGARDTVSPADVHEWRQTALSSSPGDMAMPGAHQQTPATSVPPSDAARADHSGPGDSEPRSNPIGAPGDTAERPRHRRPVLALPPRSSR